MAMVLRVCVSPQVCAGTEGAHGAALMPIARVACARWSLLRGPHKQSRGCVSGAGTPRALWCHAAPLWAGGSAGETPKSQAQKAPGTARAAARSHLCQVSGGFLSNYSKLGNCKCHKAVARWDGTISSGTERTENEEMGLRGCRALAEPGCPNFFLPSGLCVPGEPVGSPGGAMGTPKRERVWAPQQHLPHLARKTINK